jgi:hypothetical protein
MKKIKDNDNLFVVLFSKKNNLGFPTKILKKITIIKYKNEFFI